MLILNLLKKGLRMPKNKEDDLDGFQLVEDGLPDDSNDVIVVAKSYYKDSCFISSGKFDPRKGWGTEHTVLAWKPVSKTLRAYMKENSKS